jgi:Tol biopolymer transport system component
MTRSSRKIRLLSVAVLLISFVPIKYQAASLTLQVNGKIAFTSDRDGNSEIYLMNGDGTRETRLTNSSDREDYPTWSPDGRKIAYLKQSQNIFSIYIMNRDGSDPVELTRFTPNNIQEYPYERFGMSWSPDGRALAFQDGTDIFTINLDGSDRKNLTGGHFVNYEPSWSPDGSRIAFSRSIVFSHGFYPNIYTMDPDGGNIVQITTSVPYGESRSAAWSRDAARLLVVHNSMDDAYTFIIDPVGGDFPHLNYGQTPKWSPDGTKIVYYVSTPYQNISQIWLMDLDGRQLDQLTTSSPNNFHPDWQPLYQTATISGRVTAPDGRGVRNAPVTLIGPDGISCSVMTSSLGYYSINNIEPGRSYIVNVSSKKYRFNSRQIQINADLAGFDFVGLE